ncbi:protein FAR1-RELATED SEQUENCE 5-like [Camellia sinensis]|uniref:protein FAR1-RELATED SEQUENCE 5-like n=1 Tax=Camellia sinensis TaxID=4442 RepID=UPI0010366834|nr:protein FAR1-RELATED SEQUENCE 5-like [Camellia sinensis]
MDYAQFGDVVTFDTTYKLNDEHRPFSSFVGFNRHREIVIFDAALLYDETAESFVWLFQNFLEAMSRKVLKTLFTDQDAAMAKAIPIVMPDTSHQLCTWHLMQNVLKHVNYLFQDKGVNGVLNKFLFDIKDENQWKLEWTKMLDKYDAHDNHWLKLTFAVKEKWGSPYVRSTWAMRMSTTQLTESFNAFLKDYIHSDFNLNEFFMHFERVLYEKRYKELKAGYALCQRLPKYFRSIESDIEVIEYGEASTIYTVVDVGSNHARKVKMERDDSLGGNCIKFEREGILCCHSLKVIKDTLKMKEVPPQYILKRWTKQARAKTVKDITGNDIQVDVKFQQASRYKTLMTTFKAIACRATETEETYELSIAQLATLGTNVERKLSAHFGVENEVSNDDATQSFEVDCEDVNHVGQPKELKKKVATSKGKMRVKGEFEAALVHQHVPPLQPFLPLHPLPPSLAMGGNSIPPPWMYPTYHVHVDITLGFDILKNQIVQCVVRLSTGRKRWNALEIEVIAAETVKQTYAEIVHVVVAVGKDDDAGPGFENRGADVQEASEAESGDDASSGSGSETDSDSGADGDSAPESSPQRKRMKRATRT